MFLYSVVKCIGGGLVFPVWSSDNAKVKPALKISLGEHCRTFALLFPPQICPNVEEIIVNLEYHLQAMNGITAFYIHIKTPVTSITVTQVKSYFTIGQK